MKLLREKRTDAELLDDATKMLAIEPDLQNGLKLIVRYEDGRVISWPWNEDSYASTGKVLGFLQDSNLENVAAIEMIRRPV